MPPPPIHPRAGNWRFVRLVLFVVAVPIALVALFYVWENWRGRRAWENCKRELQAKGVNLDWAAHIPTPVADEENVLKAPKMADWFLRPDRAKRDGWTASELTTRLGTLAPANLAHRSNAVAAITIVLGPDEPLPPADLVLNYSRQVLSMADSNSITPGTEKIPLIEFREVPLTMAVANLARQFGGTAVFEPQILAEWRAGNVAEPLVHLRWEDLTARAALIALLDIHNFSWVEDAETGVGRVVARKGAGPHVVHQEMVEARLTALLEDAAERGDSVDVAAKLKDVRGRKFIAGPLPEVKTLRLTVRADRVPKVSEVEGFLPRHLKLDDRSGWRVAVTGPNTFDVVPREETVSSAAEYLASSDRFQREFAILRAALQRPRVQIPGDYQRPFSLPTIDFVGVRLVSQLLAERAQCYLVLGKPEPALEELTLLHDLRRLLGGKPTLLVTAMIDAAIAGLYTGIIADGLALGVWQESQLVALQKQLAAINLPPAVFASLRTEGAAACQTLVQLKRDELIELFRFEESQFGSELAQPPHLLIKFAPRGWIYQNAVTIADTGQAAHFGVFDEATGVVHPGKAVAGALVLEQALTAWNPYTILASRVLPDFSRAMQITARNQTSVNQAFIACALERYRMAHNEYPPALNALVPAFADALPLDLIGGQLLHYRREADGRFTLYSIGWNETDDGGQPAAASGPSGDFTKGDWIWRTPLY